MVTKKLVCPDGGYGWVIVGAYALHHLIAVPITPGFGLLFKDRFRELGFSAQDTAVIINTNTAFSMFIGIFNGPLLKHLGYRRVSLYGAAFMTIGILLTAFADRFFEYIITHGIITAAGIGMGMSSYPLALNSFFCRERPKAAGYAMTIGAIGPIIMPQVICYLSTTYGEQGGMIVIGALAGHTFVSAVLLQPIEWHMIEKIVEDEDDEGDDELLEKESDNKGTFTPYDRKEAASKLSFQEADIQMEAAYGVEMPLAKSMISIYNALSEKPTPVTTIKTPFQRSISMHNEESLGSAASRQRSSSWSARRDEARHHVELLGRRLSPNGITYSRSTTKNAEDYVKRDAIDIVLEEDETERRSSEEQSLEKLNPDDNNKDPEEIMEPSKLSDRFRKRIVEVFDLELLNDTTYVNIAIGMSFAVFAEINMNLLMPFILQDFGLTTLETATFMSTTSIIDAVFRFMVPYVTAFANQPIRIMYTWSLLLLILARFSILFATSYASILLCAVFLGLAAGFRTVYWTLVIPSYVPIEMLASAIGFQSAFNGIFVCIGGPFLGFVRDVTGSYVGCIVLVNCITGITIIMWTTEFLYKYVRCKRLPEDQKC